MIHLLKKYIKESILNFSSWKTNRKIIVIESDDWGSIRMPSITVYKNLLENDIPVDQCNYCKYDGRETSEDLTKLFETLSSIKDKNGRNAIITANFLVANPDFEKIKENGYQKYEYIRIDKDESYGGSGIINLIKQGNSYGIFRSQSHGREHINIPLWLHYLQNGSEETKIAFENNVYGISTTISKESRPSFLSAFQFKNEAEEKLMNEIVHDGLRIFEQVFGFQSKSFIAPNYTWSKSIEKTLYENGVRYLQGGPTHRYTKINNKRDSKRIRRLGSKSSSGLINLTRNVYFEPSANTSFDWIGKALKDLEIAFSWRQPATISSHRVNFMGSLHESNRLNGLTQLEKLLKLALQKWPDIEFMSSDELGEEITRK